MRTGEGSAACRNCNRAYSREELDNRRWCAACRAEVVRRANLWARAMAIFVTLALGAWIALSIRPEQFLVIWMVLLAATYVFVAKLGRRVVFEIVRGRGVPRPPD